VQVCDLIKGFTRHLFVCCLEADNGEDIRGDKACLHLRKVLSHDYSQSIFTFNAYFFFAALSHPEEHGVDSEQQITSAAFALSKGDQDERKDCASSCSSRSSLLTKY